MTRKLFVAANWKMNHGTESEAIKFFALMTQKTLLFENVELVVCPPFTSLSASCVAAQESPYKVGAQNCYFENSGAFTGEVSPRDLKELECEYVILGHSERRHLFQETDEVIAKKLTAAFESDLTPIFCIGETESERKDGQTFDVLKRQLGAGFASLSEDQAGKIIVAYEPVWAIGTGNTATPEQAQEAHHFIRQWLSEEIGTVASGNIRVIYGGSVKPENIMDLIRQADIDGALVGGASLDVESFLSIAKACAESISY